MTSPDHVRVLLDLRIDGEPIRGRLIAGGVEQEFLGWIQLATALERARGASAIAGPTVQGEHDAI